VTVSDEPTEEVTPALFDHAKRLYEVMLDRSHNEEVPVEDEDLPSVQVRVYEGHLTRLFSELGLPNPYYTKILDALKAQNCVEQIRRGGGVALSKWALLEPPTEESFKILLDRKRAPRGKVEGLEQRVRDLTITVQTLTESHEELCGIVSKLADLFDQHQDAHQQSKGDM
jgi:hypothetical protein